MGVMEAMMVTITPEIETDIPAREALLDRAFGPKRRRKTSETLRRGRLPADGLAFTARDDAGALAGTVRLWDVHAGTAGSALLLGPLAVDAARRGEGIGTQLMRHALIVARAYGQRAIILVGDDAYYSRFGFKRLTLPGLAMPGPVDAARFLGLELEPGALTGAMGRITATGRVAPADERRRKTG
ncbi:N-acetyltransferase [soil metagenome]